MAFSRFTRKAQENRKQQQVCRLCLEKKSLIKKSHIIPDFMYQELYDEKHKLRAFAPADLKEQNPRIAKPSTGTYEGGILCANCDNKVIGQYEDYASKVLYSKQDLPADLAWQNQNYQDPRDGLEFSKCWNVDYERFKLFILSILWRASICSHSFFSVVDLGPHEETIRKMILKGESGSENQYPIILWSWIRDQTTADDVILEPIRTSKESRTRYALFVNGITFDIYISQDSVPEKYREFSLKEDGTMTIHHFPKGATKKLFRLLSDI